MEICNSSVEIARIDEHFVLRLGDKYKKHQLFISLSVENLLARIEEYLRAQK